MSGGRARTRAIPWWAVAGAVVLLDAAALLLGFASRAH